MSTIRVSHDGDRNKSLDVKLDGKPAGTLEPGATVTLTTTPGKHTVEVGRQSCGAEIVLAVTPGDLVPLGCFIPKKCGGKKRARGCESCVTLKDQRPDEFDGQPPDEPTALDFSVPDTSTPSVGELFSEQIAETAKPPTVPVPMEAETFSPGEVRALRRARRGRGR